MKTKKYPILKKTKETSEISALRAEISLVETVNKEHMSEIASLKEEIKKLNAELFIQKKMSKCFSGIIYDLIVNEEKI